MPKVSVIVPVYNIENYLRECLDSLINQTLKDIEIICVDDGSPDACGDILDYYAAKDKRLRVIHKENGGVTLARKCGIKIATGEFITCVDSDDWIEPDMIEKLYLKVVKHSADICICGHFEETGDSTKKVFHGFDSGVYDKNRLLNDVYPRMIVKEEFFEWGIFPSLWAKLFKREFVEKYYLNLDERIMLGEDAASVYPSLLNANSICIIDECLYHYRQYPTSTIKKTVNPKMKEQFCVLYNSVNDVLKKDSYIYDLTEQWRDFVLFLMYPRAYQFCDDIAKLDYIFPFKNVKKGSQIIIYGMGTFGQQLYFALQKLNVCDIVACADRNYVELAKQGIQVVAPEKIENYEYDAIVIACTYAKTTESIYNDLIKKYPVDKIHKVDLELLKSKEILKMFGLL